MLHISTTTKKRKKKKQVHVSNLKKKGAGDTFKFINVKKMPNLRKFGKCRPIARDGRVPISETCCQMARCALFATTAIQNKHGLHAFPIWKVHFKFEKWREFLYTKTMKMKCFLQQQKTDEKIQTDAKSE